jgi:hypothetical protein
MATAGARVTATRGAAADLGGDDALATAAAFAVDVPPAVADCGGHVVAAEVDVGCFAAHGCCVLGWKVGFALVVLGGISDCV